MLENTQITCLHTGIYPKSIYAEPEFLHVPDDWHLWLNSKPHSLGGTSISQKGPFLLWSTVPLSFLLWSTVPLSFLLWSTVPLSFLLWSTVPLSFLLWSTVPLSFYVMGQSEPVAHTIISSYENTYTVTKYLCMVWLSSL